jgi:hypothetical protein
MTNQNLKIGSYIYAKYQNSCIEGIVLQINKTTILINEIDSYLNTQIGQKNITTKRIYKIVNQ